jgi:hypothetical protein
LALGYKSVAECQANVTSTEFAEWQAYDLIAPFGTDRLPAYFGTIAAAIYNTQRTKQSDKIWHWDDLFPVFGQTTRHQTVDEQISVVELLNLAFGGIDLRGNKALSA